MSGTAEVHRGATLVPTKLELLAGWLPSQAWFQGDPADVSSVGTFRFADPDGDVGVETILVRSAGDTYHVPLTYRGAALEDAESSLVGMMEHSVLGPRWVYDATGDPVYLVELTRVIREGDTQAVVQGQDGEVLPVSVRAEGSGVDAVADTSGLVRIVRRLGDPQFSTERARGLLTLSWTLDDQPREDVVAVLR